MSAIPYLDDSSGLVDATTVGQGLSFFGTSLWTFALGFTESSGINTVAGKEI